jgi:hypothetical protein
MKKNVPVLTRKEARSESLIPAASSSAATPRQESVPQ